jgi:hypothetical protein
MLSVAKIWAKLSVLAREPLVVDRASGWLELERLACSLELARARQFQLELFPGSARAGPSWLASRLAPEHVG